MKSLTSSGCCYVQLLERTMLRAICSFNEIGIVELQAKLERISSSCIVRHCFGVRGLDLDV